VETAQKEMIELEFENEGWKAQIRKRGQEIMPDLPVATVGSDSSSQSSNPVWSSHGCS